MRDPGQSRWLLVESGGHTCALPLANVRETMRPQPIERLGGAPAFVLGLAVIRGSSLPVVDLGGVLANERAERRFTRFVTLAVNGREVALAVEAVRGVSTLDERTFGALPPLLGSAGAEAVDALALHDAELLLILRAARLLPDAAALPREREERP
jgi:purine-binding chemotaxis protein CheW